MNHEPPEFDLSGTWLFEGTTPAATQFEARFEVMQHGTQLSGVLIATTPDIHYAERNTENYKIEGTMRATILMLQGEEVGREHYSPISLLLIFDPHTQTLAGSMAWLSGKRKRINQMLVDFIREQ